MNEIFATDIIMGESPRWHDGRLWMCDWLAGQVLSFSATGERRVEARIEGLPFSIDWLPDGRLVATTAEGLRAGDPLAHYGATDRHFNEIVVDRHGNCWVDMPGSAPWETRKPGLVGVVRVDGSWEQAADDVWFPNGMAIIDDSTLVVAESHADRITAWSLAPDGSLTDRRVWAQLEEHEAPDGICVDESGAIWYASVPQQHCVRVAEGGQVLETVRLDRGAFACMLGGKDGCTLHVVANRYGPQGASDGVVVTQRVSVPRAGRP